MKNRRENDQTIPLTCCTNAGFVRLEYFLLGLATISQLALDLGGGESDGKFGTRRRPAP